MLLKEDRIYDEATLRLIDEMVAAEQRHLVALKQEREACDCKEGMSPIRRKRWGADRFSREAPRLPGQPWRRD